MMLRVIEGDAAELTAKLNKAREVGDLAEMWQCASEPAALDRRRRAIERDHQRALSV
jgi:hypothetical protein